MVWASQVDSSHCTTVVDRVKTENVRDHSGTCTYCTTSLLPSHLVQLLSFDSSTHPFHRHVCVNIQYTHSSWFAKQPVGPLPLSKNVCTIIIFTHFSRTFSYLYVYIHLLLTSCILYRSESSTNHSKCSWK